MPFKKYIFIVFVICIFCGCSNSPSYNKAENALGAAREFIDGCLKGDFEKASFYMVDDKTNEGLLLKQKRNYAAKGDQEKNEYHEASINIFEDAVIDDSTHIINYQNSYDKTGRKVKVVNRQGAWLIDFKYTFDGNL